MKETYFTWPKIYSPSQIIRCSQSIFCLPDQPKFQWFMPSMDVCCPFLGRYHSKSQMQFLARLLCYHHFDGVYLSFSSEFLMKETCTICFDVRISRKKKWNLWWYGSVKKKSVKVMIATALLFKKMPFEVQWIFDLRNFLGTGKNFLKSKIFLKSNAPSSLKHASWNNYIYI